MKKKGRSIFRSFHVSGPGQYIRLMERDGEQDHVYLHMMEITVAVVGVLGVHL